MKGLYLVTPDWSDSMRLLEVTEQALLGGAAIVQYRNKTADAALRQRQAAQLRDLCRRHRRPFIINDFLDLCIELDADGVHVGESDTPVSVIREILGPEKIVGATCYGNLPRALEVSRAGASYVAFGGFYPSKVKKYPSTTPFDIVTDAKRQIPLPVAAIGGMTHENAPPLIAAGADMIAAISSIYLASDPEAATRQFVALFAAGERQS